MDTRLILRVGCPMWANRDWVGTFFPAATRSGEELRCYSQWCNAVEGNTSFYALPEPTAVDRWRELTPEEFRFAFKLPRHITHERRLRNAAVDVEEFCQRFEPLRERMGPVMIQLPASFSPDDTPVLGQFLSGVPRDLDWAVEVRHEQFCRGGDDERRLNELLHAHGVDRVVIDTRALFAGPSETPAEREAFERKPRLTVRPVATGWRPIVRFIGQSDPAECRRFWAKWLPVLARWLGEGREPYVFTHTPDNAIAPGLARELHAEVAELVPTLATLPEVVPALSTQARLL